MVTSVDDAIFAYFDSMGMSLEPVSPGELSGTYVIYLNASKHAIGVYHRPSGPLPRVEWVAAPGQTHVFELRDWGPGVEHGLVVLSHVATAGADLGRALALPAARGPATLAVSVFRFDAAGQRVAEGPVEFAVEQGPDCAMDMWELGVMRYPDDSSEGVPLTSDGGTVTVDECWRMGLTSPRTSSFVLHSAIPTATPTPEAPAPGDALCHCEPAPACEDGASD